MKRKIIYGTCVIMAKNQITIQPKKSLGQNFFINKNLAEKIVQLTTQQNPKVILEIGGGTGVFSKLLIRHVNELIIIEKDNTLANRLQNEIPKAQVINADFLEITQKTLIQNRNECVAFGSLPYNISKPIIFHIAEYFDVCTELYAIIQKEVAEKFARDNNRIGILIRNFFSPKILIRNIQPENFKPKPKVTSTFILFKRNQSQILPPDDYKLFRQYINFAFSHPRKKLGNNLKGFKLSEGFSNKRAEKLNFDEHLNIFIQNKSNLLEKVSKN